MRFKRLTLLRIYTLLIFIIVKRSHEKNSKISSYTQNLLRFCNFGFKAVSEATLTEKQLFSLKRAFQKKIRSLLLAKSCKLWCLLTTNPTITKLSFKSRMGKRKGSIYRQIDFVQPGFMLYELQNVFNHHDLQLFRFFKRANSN